MKGVQLGGSCSIASRLPWMGMDGPGIMMRKFRRIGLTRKQASHFKSPDGDLVEAMHSKVEPVRPTARTPEFFTCEQYYHS